MRVLFAAVLFVFMLHSAPSPASTPAPAPAPAPAPIVSKIPLFDGTSITFPVPSTWTTQISTGGYYLRLESRDSKDPVIMLLTFIPNMDNTTIEDNQAALLTFKMAPAFAPGTIHDGLNLYTLDTRLGKAYLAGFNEKKYQGSKEGAEKGFMSITMGAMTHPLAIISFTILSNGTDSESLAIAKSIITNLVLERTADTPPADQATQASTDKQENPTPKAPDKIIP